MEENTVTIEKVTIPAGVDTPFAFTHDLDASGNSFLKDGNSKTFANVSSGGTYTIFEQMTPVDWQLTAIDCHDTATGQSFPGDVASRSVVLQGLTVGERILCKFTKPYIATPRAIPTYAPGSEWRFRGHVCQGTPGGTAVAGQPCASGTMPLGGVQLRLTGWNVGDPTEKTIDFHRTTFSNGYCNILVSAPANFHNYRLTMTPPTGLGGSAVLVESGAVVENPNTVRWFNPSPGVHVTDFHLVPATPTATPTATDSPTPTITPTATDPPHHHPDGGARPPAVSAVGVEALVRVQNEPRSA